MKCFLVSVLSLSSAFAQGEVPPRFLPIGDITLRHTFDSIPRWSGGALVAIEKNPSALPVIRVFDQEGRQAAEIAVKIPGADWIDVRSAAQGVRGTIAICGSAKDSEARVAGFLALASADGKIQSLIRTEPYVPTAVTISQDGTIWTKGAEFEPVKRTPAKTDNGILRHFDASGTLLAKFLPQSSLSRRELFLGIDQLVSNSSRVGWYMGRGAITYFEVFHDQIERYPAVEVENVEGQEFISGLTITDDNRVFVTKDIRGNNPELYMLNRASRRWTMIEVPAAGSPAATNWLVGGMGNTLVFRTTAGFGCLRRFEVPR